MQDAPTKTALLFTSAFSREKARASLPSHLADHEIISFIAQGSYGDVFLARNSLTGQYHAIKIVWKGEYGEGRACQRELQALRRFEPISRTHPGFVHILHIGELEDAFFYVMELADDQERGQNIDPTNYRAKTLHRTRLSPLECVSFGITIADALVHLHSHSLLHRDIKPSNIVCCGGRPKLADIGLVADADGTRSFVGTDGFIAPEGPNGYQSDIYSLGKTLYELATGRDRHDFPSLPDDITDDGLLLELNEIILRACDPDPKRRYHSAADFKKELAAMEAGRSIQKLRRVERQFRRALIAGACLLVCGVIGFILFARQKAVERRDAEERQRRFGTLLARGTEALTRGDYANALKSYVPLALEDAGNEAENLVRLGTTLDRCVVPTNIWVAGNVAHAFSGDRLLFAASSKSNTTLHRTLTGELLWSVDAPAQHLSLDHDGSRLFAANGPNITAYHWQKQTSESFSCESKVVNLNFAADHLCITLPDQLLLRDANGGARRFPFASEPFQSFLSPSGKIAATGLYDGRLLLWNAATGELFPDAPRNGHLVYNATFSSDENRILIASFHRSALAWHLDLGGEVGHMPHNDGITRAVYIPPLGMIATAGLDRVIKLWSDKTYQPVPENHRLYTEDRVVDVAFIPPRSLVSVSSLGTNTVWDLAPLTHTAEILSEPLPIPSTLMVSRPEASLVAEGRTVTGFLGEKPLRLEFDDQVGAIAVNEDLSLLAVGTIDGSINPHSVHLFTLTNQVKIQEFPHRDGIRFITFSPDGTKLLVCDEDFLAILWDIASARPAIPRLRHTDQVTWATFSGSGRWIATASADRCVRVWDAATGEPVTAPMNCSTVLEYVTFTPDDQALVAGNGYSSFHLPLTRVHPRELPTFTSAYLSSSQRRP